MIVGRTGERAGVAGLFAVLLLTVTATIPAASSVDNPTGIGEGFDPDWTFPAPPNQKWHDAAGVDIDADRYDELIVASSNALWAFDDEHNLTQTPNGPMPSVLWRHRVGYVERFKVVDLQGDGRPELVASVFAGPGSNQCTGHAPGQISVYDAITGDWIASYEGPHSASVRDFVLADLNDDRVQDIVVSNTDDQRGDTVVQDGFDGAFAIDGGKLLAHGDPGPAGVQAAGPEDVRMWVFEDPVDQPVSGSFRNIAAAALPGGGSRVVYHGYDSVFALDGQNGTVEWTVGWSGLADRPHIADLDGGGQPVAILNLGGHLHLFDLASGDWQRAYDAMPGLMRLAITSINDDGRKDFVVLGRETVDGPAVHRFRLWGVDGATDELSWEIDLGTTMWDPFLYVVELDGKPGSEILLEEGQGFYMEGLSWNQRRRPVMLAIDPHEGVIEWEQWVHSHSDRSDSDRSLAAADLDGTGHTEVVNVGYKLLSGWEPALDENRTAHEDDEYGGLSTPTAGCFYPVR